MKWRSLEESAAADDARPLHELLAERKRQIQKYVPQAVLAVHDHAVEELNQRGVMDRIPAVGSQAPDFELQDQNGRAISSQAILNFGPTIVCFFRGRWCPFCVTQLEAMNRVLPRIKSAGASLLAISPQTMHQNGLMASQHSLSFPLLSDEGNQVAHRFGLAYKISSEQQALYRKSFINLSFINGDESWQLPIPASFVLDKQGFIRFASASPDYTARPEPEDLIRALHAQG